jgi:hypothetical protein
LIYTDPSKGCRVSGVCAFLTLVGILAKKNHMVGQSPMRGSRPIGTAMSRDIEAIGFLMRTFERRLGVLAKGVLMAIARSADENPLPSLKSDARELLSFCVTFFERRGNESGARTHSPPPTRRPS